ncbi:MAG: SIS domain-containing protein [Ignavibacteriales bacterium]|nr:SIS domain-containing protein [Ignavibacteriales bacterium]
MALEGALKLKEISYIHAEGYAAGEIKHGPIALINPETPSVFLVPDDHLREKTITNMKEIKARGGPVIAFGVEGDEDVRELADDFIGVPKIDERFYPFLMSAPSSYSPTSAPWSSTGTWTSPGTWPRASPLNKRSPAGGFGSWRRLPCSRPPGLAMRRRSPRPSLRGQSWSGAPCRFAGCPTCRPTPFRPCTGNTAWRPRRSSSGWSGTSCSSPRNGRRSLSDPRRVPGSGRTPGPSPTGEGRRTAFALRDAALLDPGGDPFRGREIRCLSWKPWPSGWPTSRPRPGAPRTCPCRRFWSSRSR